MILQVANALQPSDVQDGAVIHLEPPLQVQDVEDCSFLKPQFRNQGVLPLSAILIPPGMTMNSAVQTSLTVKIVRLIVPQSENFVFDSIRVGREEIIPGGTPASLFSLNSLGVPALLLVGEHMVITVQNVSALPQTFRAAAFYTI
jgi:hypothetical protein